MDFTAEIGLPGSFTAAPSAAYHAPQASMTAFCSSAVSGIDPPSLSSTKSLIVPPPARRFDGRASTSTVNDTARLARGTFDRLGTRPAFMEAGELPLGAIALGF